MTQAGWHCTMVRWSLVKWNFLGLSRFESHCQSGPPTTITRLNNVYSYWWEGKNGASSVNTFQNMHSNSNTSSPTHALVLLYYAHGDLRDNGTQASKCGWENYLALNPWEESPKIQWTLVHKIFRKRSVWTIRWAMDGKNSDAATYVLEIMSRYLFPG